MIFSHSFSGKMLKNRKAGKTQDKVWTKIFVRERRKSCTGSKGMRRRSIAGRLSVACGKAFMGNHLLYEQKLPFTYRIKGT